MLITDLKLLLRDWRGGQLNLVVSALVLAVMVVTAVSLFADRVEKGLNAQITSFLASDLSLRANVPVEGEYRQAANRIGLDLADTATFGSMVFAGDVNHLASVKAVSELYPLRGVLELSADDQGTSILESSTGPKSGEAWVEPRLLNLLDIRLGDSIEVGYLDLKVTQLIVNEPDRGAGFGGAGARVMMHWDDLEESQLVRPGSRINYSLLMRGSESQVQSYQEWFDKHTASLEDAYHHQLRTPENAEEQLADALQRGRSFLLLSGTIGVLLAGLAMALASQRYASRLTNQVALMKAWGVSAWQVRRSQLIRLTTIALVSSLFGMVLGFLSHYLLLELAQGLFEIELPPAGLRPWLVALATGVLCVIGFALPALWHLPDIAPLKVLRKDLPTGLLSSTRRWVIGTITLLLLIFWYSQSFVTTVLFFAALALLLAICAVVALQFMSLLRGFGRWRGSVIRLGLANLWRRRGQTLIQLVGFSATLMLLLVVTGMRTSLIQEWEAQLPDDVPSHFIFNVAGPEVEPVKQMLTDDGLSTTPWFPMVRGRLVEINGENIPKERMARSDGLQREVNLTQSFVLPEGNKVVDGEWWRNAPNGFEFSLEEDVAGEIGLRIGDIVTFSVGGIKFEARLASIRQVDWQSMNPNFYIVFYPGALDAYASNWVTAVKGALSESKAEDQSLLYQAPFIGKMVKQFPTAVVIELANVIERIRDLITRVTQGLEMILLLVLACGIMVLFAAIGVSYDERLRENAVLRTLGSSRKTVLGSLLTEYVALGAISGIIAAIGAETILYFVQTEVFTMTAKVHPELWTLGVSGGILLVASLGMLRSWSLVTAPPLQSLREVG